MAKKIRLHHRRRHRRHRWGRQGGYRWQPPWWARQDDDDDDDGDDGEYEFQGEEEFPQTGRWARQGDTIVLFDV